MTRVSYAVTDAVATPRVPFQRELTAGIVGDNLGRLGSLG